MRRRGSGVMEYWSDGEMKQKTQHDSILHHSSPLAPRRTTSPTAPTAASASPCAPLTSSPVMKTTHRVGDCACGVKKRRDDCHKTSGRTFTPLNVSVASPARQPAQRWCLMVRSSSMFVMSTSLRIASNQSSPSDWQRRRSLVRFCSISPCCQRGSCEARASVCIVFCFLAVRRL